MGLAGLAGLAAQVVSEWAARAIDGSTTRNIAEAHPTPTGRRRTGSADKLVVIRSGTAKPVRRSKSTGKAGIFPATAVTVASAIKAGEADWEIRLAEAVPEIEAEGRVVAEETASAAKIFLAAVVETAVPLEAEVGDLTDRVHALAARVAPPVCVVAVVAAAAVVGGADRRKERSIGAAQ